MSMDLAVHQTQLTNSVTFSSYTRFYPKTFGEDKLSCPLCSFQGHNKAELQRHYSSSFHRLEFLKETTKNARIPAEMSQKEGETKKYWQIRTSLLEHIGIPPPYLKVTLIKGYPAFSHALPRSHPESFHSRTSRGEILLKPLDVAIRYGEALEHEMFFMYQTSSRTRAFLSFPSFKEYWKVLSSTKDGDKRYHELFVPDHPTREIFDLENDKHPEGHFDTQTIFDLFSKARKEFEPETNLKFYCLESCGQEGDKYKFSLHILTNKMHADLVSMKGMFDEFIRFLSGRKEYFVLSSLLDRGVYTKNRTIRAPWSVKSDSLRRLVPFGKEEKPREYFATAHSHLFVPTVPQEVEYKEEKEEPVSFSESEDFGEYLQDYCDREFPECFEVTEELSASVHSWRLQRRDGMSNFCPICQREHTGDNMYAFEKDDKLILGCHRGTAEGKKAKVLLKRPGAKTKVDFFKRVQTDIPELLADEVYDLKEVPDFIQRDGTATFVVSAMGTGKTKALVRYIQRQPKASVLFVTYRRSLAKELWSKLEGFSHYEDLSGEINKEKLVIQVDSLHRCVRTKYDIVVCDEASYMLGRLATCIKNTEECWDVLENYLKSANESFFLDKNMSSTEVDVLARLGISTFVIRNDFKAHTARTCLVSPDFLEFKSSLLDDLVSGLKICFASSSKKKLEVVCKEAETLGHSVLWYTGDGKSQDVWLDGWDKYDMVAYTPTISAGVSYERKHFDKMYGYFSSWSCCAEECEQMLFRVRNIEKNEMVICFDGRGMDVPTTRKGVRASIKKDHNCCRSLPTLKWDRRTPGCPLDMAHVFTRLYVDTIVKQNVSKKALAVTLLCLLKGQGVNIKIRGNEMTEEEREDALEQLAETKGILEREETVAFCGSPAIQDNHQFEYLCNLKDRTKEESYSIKKYIMASRLQVEQEDVTPEFFVTYKDQVKQFANLKIAFSGTEEEQKARLLEMSDELNFAKEEMTTIQKLKCGTRLEKIVYAKRLLKLLGFGDILARKRIGKDEMSQRLSCVRKTVLKSRYFQQLFGKLPESEDLLLRWVNGVLRGMFGCSVQKTSKSKCFYWHLSFVSPWLCNEKELETKCKFFSDTKIPSF
ncbi:replication [Tunisvirus fontaine2]|uniref:Putative origin of replication binding protein n=1 Tax=Tunisvirus fontaine2 TaxID=1421067 RepID=V9SGC4_9VIRU|nr:replication [Tunisvirus fontaine2]AHC54807.1 putative origin of replication binding protein [Tunisvirus fontaine2]